MYRTQNTLLSRKLWLCNNDLQPTHAIFQLCKQAQNVDGSHQDTSIISYICIKSIRLSLAGVNVSKLLQVVSCPTCCFLKFKGHIIAAVNCSLYFQCTLLISCIIIVKDVELISVYTFTQIILACCSIYCAANTCHNSICSFTPSFPQFPESPRCPICSRAFPQKMPGFFLKIPGITKT